MTRKFVSSGAHLCAVIATMNLVLMAAIANDESVGNRTSSSGPSVSGGGGGPPSPRALPSLSAAAVVSAVAPSSSSASSSSSKTVGVTSPPVIPTASATYYPVSPSILSLVRSQSFDYSVNTNKPAMSKTNNESSIAVTPIPLMLARSSASHNVNHPDYNYNSTISSSSSSSSFDVLMNSSTSPFVTLNSTVLRAQYKSNAMLPCNVRNSGDGVTVSWIRRKDYHLLTVGLQTYSSDDRFTAIHAQSPDDWTLKIKYVQPRDAGIYECQVSTHPPSSIFVTLLVVEARAEIVGGPEKFYKAGSSVELRCDLIDSTEEPEYVFWYQGLRMINYDPSRHINVTHSKTSSMLVIHNVQKTDSGNYTCVPSNAHPASIFVHIINGENPAAMQHGSHSTTCVPCPPLWFLSFLLSLALQTFYLRFLSRNVDHNHHHHHSNNNLSHNPQQQQYDERQETGDNNNSTTTIQQSHPAHHHLHYQQPHNINNQHHNHHHEHNNHNNQTDSNHQQQNISFSSCLSLLPVQESSKVTTINHHALAMIQPMGFSSSSRHRRKCQVGVLR